MKKGSKSTRRSKKKESTSTKHEKAKKQQQNLLSSPLFCRLKPTATTHWIVMERSQDKKAAWEAAQANLSRIGITGATPSSSQPATPTVPSQPTTPADPSQQQQQQQAYPYGYGSYPNQWHNYTGYYASPQYGAHPHTTSNPGSGPSSTTHPPPTSAHAHMPGQGSHRFSSPHTPPFPQGPPLPPPPSSSSSPRPRSQQGNYFTYGHPPHPPPPHGFPGPLLPRPPRPPPPGLVAQQQQQQQHAHPSMSPAERKTKSRRFSTDKASTPQWSWSTGKEAQEKSFGPGAGIDMSRMRPNATASEATTLNKANGWQSSHSVGQDAQSFWNNRAPYGVATVASEGPISLDGDDDEGSSENARKKPKMISDAFKKFSLKCYHNCTTHKEKTAMRKRLKKLYTKSFSEPVDWAALQPFKPGDDDSVSYQYSGKSRWSSDGPSSSSDLGGWGTPTGNSGGGRAAFKRYQQGAADEDEDGEKRARRSERFGHLLASPATSNGKKGKKKKGKKKGAEKQNTPWWKNADEFDPQGGRRRLGTGEVVVGTCTDLEKGYFRINDAVQPSRVRPEHILKKAFDHVKRKFKAGEPYKWVWSQFKAIRQDMTVQHIETAFTVKVYETAARIALENTDHEEFNQCQAKLMTLYAKGIPGCREEFLAYRIFDSMYMRCDRDLNRYLDDLTADDLALTNVAHALNLREALAQQNYIRYFRLYNDTGDMGMYLLDLFLPRVRKRALRVISKAFRPSLPLDVLARMLNFSDVGSTARDLATWDGEEEIDPRKRKNCTNLIDFLVKHKLGLCVDKSKRVFDCKKASTTPF